MNTFFYCWWEPARRVIPLDSGWTEERIAALAEGVDAEEYIFFVGVCV